MGTGEVASGPRHQRGEAGDKIEWIEHNIRRTFAKGLPEANDDLPPFVHRLPFVGDGGSGYAPTAWPGDAATILLHDARATVAGAAFANACAANGLDCDDGGVYTRGHQRAQVFPTAMALCESMGLGGREMLTAVVAGYEISHRFARCWHDHLHPVYQADGSWGSVGSAATAARLMGLDAPTIEQALGIAEYHAANLPMERDLVDKMELVESEEFNELYRPAFEGGDEGYSPGRVTIRFDDGSTIDSGVVTESCRIGAHGEEERLEEKFRWLTGYVLGQDRVDRLLEMLWNFEVVDDVGRLAAMLRRR